MSADFFTGILGHAISCLSIVLDSFSPVFFFVAACCVIGAAITFIRFAISLRG